MKLSLRTILVCFHRAHLYLLFRTFILIFIDLLMKQVNENENYINWWLLNRTIGIATPNTIPRLIELSACGVKPLGLLEDWRTWKLGLDAVWILDEIVLYKPFTSPVGELYEDYTTTEPLDTLVTITLLISSTDPIYISIFCIYPQFFINSRFFSAEVDWSFQVLIRGLRTSLTPT